MKKYCLVVCVWILSSAPVFAETMYTQDSGLKIIYMASNKNVLDVDLEGVNPSMTCDQRIYRLSRGNTNYASMASLLIAAYNTNTPIRLFVSCEGLGSDHPSIEWVISGTPDY